MSAWRSENDDVTGGNKILWNFPVDSGDDLLIVKLILNVDKREPDTPMVGIQIAN